MCGACYLVQTCSWSLLHAALATVAGGCEDGSVRIEGGQMDSLAGTMDGRLEICINNAWGTVCNNTFRSVDTAVACGQLVNFEREGKCSCLKPYIIIHV